MPEKLLSNFRRNIEGFEVIQCPPEEAERLRARTKLDPPEEMFFQFDYEPHYPEIVKLYKKAKAEQWDADRALDWSRGVGPDTRLMSSGLQLIAEAGLPKSKEREMERNAVTWILSQMLHGEQTGIIAAGFGCSSRPEMEVKFFLGTLVMDEVRHAEVFSRFLMESMERIEPVTPPLKVFLDGILTEPDIAKRVVVGSTILEGMELAQIQMFRAMTVHPLLKEMMLKVAVDEARHVAFGLMILKREMERFSEAQRAALEDHAFTYLEALCNGLHPQFVLHMCEKHGLDPEEALGRFLQTEGHRAMNRLVFGAHVVPNLRKLGLITSRTEAGYRKLGLI